MVCFDQNMDLTQDVYVFLVGLVWIVASKEFVVDRSGSLRG